MKKFLKRTIPMHIIANGRLIGAMLVIGLCSFRISSDLLDSEMYKKLNNNEVIEVGYTENVLIKLADSNNRLEPEEEKALIEDESEQVEPSESVVEVAPEPVEVVEPVVLMAQTNVELGTEIANFASQFIGNPYAYGGTSLTTGADCSGFTMAVYSNFGISLPRTATDQSYSGKEVSLDYLQPGDLLFYGYGAITHVAIYIGNGQVVHAMNESKGINVSSYTIMPIIKAVRVI